MSFLYIIFFLQLSILHTYPFQPIVITQPSFVLYARQLKTDRGFLSDRYDDREETDGRPNYIHRAQVADSHPRKLLEFVYTVFPDVKRTQAKQWLQHESLLINDEPQSKFDLPLRIGDWISVRAGKSKRMSRSSSGESGKKPYGTLPSGLKIIYEDDSLFVVEKPHGLAVSSSKNVGSSASRNGKKSVTNSTETADKVGQKTTARRNEPATKTVHSIVSSYLGKRSGSVDSKVFVVNWLDDDVSGLVIFAKSSVSREFMLRNWNSFGVMYTVLCEGLLFPQQGTITTYMNEELPNVQCSLTKWDMAEMKGPGLPSPAISHYRTLESVSSSSLSGDRAKDYENAGMKLNPEVHSRSLMELSLETTRRDQARAQFAFLGHSVCGDYRYGPLARLESLGTSAASASASAVHDSTEGGGDGEGVGSGVIDEKESERQVALHDPLRRLGLHFSELRLTHPTTNSALTFTSNCPSSFTDLMRRSQGSSRASLVQFKSAVTDISSTAGRVGDTHSASAGESRGTADRTRGSDGQLNKGGRKSVEDEDEDDDEDGDGDGRMDSLRSGSTQYASESASSSSEKVKVFTLSEFLGPGKVRGGGRDKRQERDQQGPPPSSKTVFRRK